MLWSHTCILALEVSLSFHAAIVLSPRLVVPLKAHPLAALTADLANVAHGGALTADLQPLVDVEGMLLHCSHQRTRTQKLFMEFQSLEGTSSLACIA
jgi:hypothetical protein